MHFVAFPFSEQLINIKYMYTYVYAYTWLCQLWQGVLSSKELFRSLSSSYSQEGIHTPLLASPPRNRGIAVARSWYSRGIVIFGSYLSIGGSVGRGPVVGSGACGEGVVGVGSGGRSESGGAGGRGPKFLEYI